MPNSHQEDNAKIFEESNSAIILNQEKILGDVLAESIKKILNNKDFSNLLSKNIKKIIKRNANSEIKNVVLELL
jgi:UDP-N-acetylglucosamine:LPS N-acetylglucosamine transferase